MIPVLVFQHWKHFKRVLPNFKKNINPLLINNKISFLSSLSYKKKRVTWIIKNYSGKLDFWIQRIQESGLPGQEGRVNTCGTLCLPLQQNIRFNTNKIFSHNKNKKGNLHGYIRKGLLLCKIKTKLLQSDPPYLPVRPGKL